MKKDELTLNTKTTDDLVVITSSKRRKNAPLRALASRAGTTMMGGVQAEADFQLMHIHMVDSVGEAMQGHAPTSTKPTSRRTPAIGSLGFHGDPSNDPHIRVRVGADTVQFSEFLYNSMGITAEIPRAVISRERWEELSGRVEEVLKERVTAKRVRGTVDIAPVAFGTDQTYLSNENVGKELMILVWACEGAELTAAEIDTAVTAWTALLPAERWWLYNQTASRHGKLADAGRGWRQALRHMLIG